MSQEKHSISPILSFMLYLHVNDMSSLTRELTRVRCRRETEARLRMTERDGLSRVLHNTHLGEAISRLLGWEQGLRGCGRDTLAVLHGMHCAGDAVEIAVPNATPQAAHTHTHSTSSSTFKARFSSTALRIHTESHTYM